MVTLQYCTALRRCWLTSVKPLNLNIPNDIFNGETRDYIERQSSVTVDGKLTASVIYDGNDSSVRVERGTARTIGLQHISMPSGSLNNSIVWGDRGMLRVDKILIGGSDKPAWRDRGGVIFDFGAADKHLRRAGRLRVYTRRRAARGEVGWRGRQDIYRGGEFRARHADVRAVRSHIRILC